MVPKTCFRLQKPRGRVWCAGFFHAEVILLCRRVVQPLHCIRKSRSDRERWKFLGGQVEIPRQNSRQPKASHAVPPASHRQNIRRAYPHCISQCTNIRARFSSASRARSLDGRACSKARAQLARPQSGLGAILKTRLIPSALCRKCHLLTVPSPKRI